MINDNYIKQTDIDSLNVKSAPNKLEGNAKDNKKIFDKLPEFIAQKHNGLVEELTQKGTQPVRSGDISVVRVNTSSGILEYSKDNGDTWAATASSGHRILNEYGDILIQRGDLQFVGTELFDDGVKTVIKGIKGEIGERGEQGIQGIQGATGEQGIEGNQGVEGKQGVKGDKGETGNDGSNGNDFIVRGTFPSLLALQGARPDGGEVGEAWFVGTDVTNPIYLWHTNSNTWENVGKIQGPQGSQGIQGERGVQGEKGVQGNQGVQGVQGIEGKQGQRGEAGVQGAQGQGVVTGGTVGQVLAKKSGTSFDTQWKSLTAQDVGAGTAESVVTAQATADAAQATATAAMPKSGGTFVGGVVADNSNRADSCLRNIHVNGASTGYILMVRK